MYFRLIQAIFISVACIGWVAYQMLYRKKRFSELFSDIMAIVFFMAVWAGLVYWLTS